MLIEKCILFEIILVSSSSLQLMKLVFIGSRHIFYFRIYAIGLITRKHPLTYHLVYASDVSTRFFHNYQSDSNIMLVFQYLFYSICSIHLLFLSHISYHNGALDSLHTNCLASNLRSFSLVSMSRIFSPKMRR